jgi:hypothetical protein
LPGLDGYGVARRLADDPDLAGMPLGASFDDCISKPIVPLAPRGRLPWP